MWKKLTFKFRPKILVPLDGEWGEQDGVRDSSPQSEQCGQAQKLRERSS